MPYLVSSIIAIVAALIVLMTRYEADDSTITSEIERAKSQFLAVDGFVNTYIQSGGDMSKINFEQLFNDGILLGNITKGIPTSENNVTVAAGDIGDKSFQATLKFPNSNIIWQIVPIVSGDTIKDSTGTDKNISSSAGTGYKVFVDFSANLTLKSKDAFSENFFGKEICEKILFGNFINNATSISITTATLNQIITTNGTNKDSKFACIVFK